MWFILTLLFGASMYSVGNMKGIVTEREREVKATARITNINDRRKK
jgi:hypothetical protein